MKKEPRIFLTKKRHVLVLIIVISVLLAVGAYFYFSYEEQTIHNEKHNELKAIAGLKISQISNWNKERLADATAFSQNPFFVNYVEQLLTAKKKSFLKSEILKQFSLIKEGIGYEDIILVNAGRRLLVSFDSKQKDIDSTTSTYVKRSIKDRKIINSDLYFCQTHKEIHLDYIAPVITKNNVVVAAMIFRINPKNYLYPLIEKWPASSKTSETSIVRKDGGSVLFLNDLSHQKNTELKLRIPLTREEVPAVQAVLGLKGIFEGKDYRGVDVLAYVEQVPNTNWFMIAKVDQSEIYADLYFREIVIISFAILLILVLSAGLVWYYHYRQKNIYKELFVKEKELREYHEEFRTILYNIGDGIITTDTNGNVKQMNHTAEELIGWNEAEANGKSLKEVFNIINEESRKEVENPVERVLREGVVVGLANHTLLISKDGKEIPIADSGAPIRNEQGEIEGVVLVFHDKTVEYHAEKIIQQSEARLKRAELVSKAGNWELHLDSKMMIVSEGAAKIYGAHGSQFEYNLVKKIPLPEYRTILDDALLKLIENGEPYNLEFKIKTINTGEIKDIHSVAHYDKENRILFGVIQDITERKRAEEALTSSEEKFRLLLENAPVGIYYVNLKGDFIYGNKVAEKIIGYKKEELIGKNFLTINLLSFKDLAKATKLFALNVLGKPTGPDQFELIRKDGGRIQTEISTQIITIEGHKIVMGMVQDITERKRAEETLRESEDRYKRLIETTTNGVAVYQNGKFVYVNPSGLKLMGCTNPDELLGKPVLEIVHPSSHEAVIKRMQKVAAGNSVPPFEEKLIRLDGTIFDAEVSAINTIFNGMPAAQVIVQDITERKNAEAQLFESRERMRMLVEGTPHLFFYTQDINANVNYVSPSVEAITGYKVERWLGQSHWFTTDSEINQLARKITHAHLRGEYTEGPVFLEITHANGNIIFLEVYENSIIRNDKVVGIQGIAHNITERKKIMEELIIAKEKAEQSDKLKTEFLAQMSHEIRSPMYVTLGMVSLIKDELDEKLSSQLSTYFNGIDSAGKRLIRTVDLILNASEMQVGTYQPMWEDFDLCKHVLNSLLTEYEPQAKMKSLKLNFKSSLPEPHIFADQYSIQQIFTNLIDNAIKFTNHGSIDVTIDNDAPQNIRVVVSDTGIGMSKEFMSMMYEPFVQEDRGYTRRYEGNGLGLALVKKYCELNNTSITVESEKGKGTVFTVIFKSH